MKKKVLAGMLALAMCLSACTPKSNPEETGLFKAGTYTAEAQGMNGAVKVEVVFTADRIETVTVTDHAETAGISDSAIERVPDAITEHQSLGVDTVAGATITSNAILAAVEDCAKQAGADIEALKQPVEGGDTVKTEEERTAGMVIVGSGISGLAAAISAAEAGVENIVVLEKMATTGGDRKSVV